MATFPTTYVPSYASSLDQQPKILEAKFGDGYEQAVFNGINYDPEKWSLKFSNISLADADAIISFFTTNNTAITPFDWTNPNSVAGKYKCRDWKRSYDGYEHHTVTCVFEEVYWG